MSNADRNKPPLSLEKLIALVVSLVEKSRNISGQLELSDNDLYVLQGMKVTFIIIIIYRISKCCVQWHNYGGRRFGYHINPTHDFF